MFTYRLIVLYEVLFVICGCSVDLINFVVRVILLAGSKIATGILNSCLGNKSGSAQVRTTANLITRTE